MRVLWIQDESCRLLHLESPAQGGGAPVNIPVSVTFLFDIVTKMCRKGCGSFERGFNKSLGWVLRGLLGQLKFERVLEGREEK